MGIFRDDMGRAWLSWGPPSISPPMREWLTVLYYVQKGNHILYIHIHLYYTLIYTASVHCLSTIVQGWILPGIKSICCFSELKTFFQYPPSPPDLRCFLVESTSRWHDMSSRDFQCRLVYNSVHRWYGYWIVRASRMSTFPCWSRKQGVWRAFHWCQALDMTLTAMQRPCTTSAYKKQGFPSVKDPTELLHGVAATKSYISPWSLPQVDFISRLSFQNKCDDLIRIYLTSKDFKAFHQVRLWTVPLVSVPNHRGPSPLISVNRNQHLAQYQIIHF